MNKDKHINYLEELYLNMSKKFKRTAIMLLLLGIAYLIK